LNILLIDDDESVLDSVSLVLQSAGFKITKANDGEDGIKKFDGSSFDIVITDLSMPLRNGDEVGKHIRNNGKSVPIICITGTPEDADLNCFDLVLEKPFSLKKLVEHVQSIESDGKIRKQAD
jgi:DNA-binding response OmpR family regulator